MPYPVMNLIEGRSEPISVRPADSVARALSLMIEYEFGQLPVVDEADRPLGMVTHESILKALSNFCVKLDELRVSNAVVRAQTYRPEDDLFDLLDRLKETNAVLIVDGEERLIGIVTSYDSTEYFRRRAEDMMLVEDIESMVKDLVLAAFTDETGEIDQAKLQPVIEAVASSTTALMGRYRKALQRYLELQGQEQPQLDKKGVKDSSVKGLAGERQRDSHHPNLARVLPVRRSDAAARHGRPDLHRPRSPRRQDGTVGPRGAGGGKRVVGLEETIHLMGME